MKIIFATDQYWPSISGVSVSVDAFRRELIKKGHTVHIFAPSYPDSDEYDKRINNPFIHRFRSFQFIFSKENYLVKGSEKKKLHALIDEIKPDLIHIHTEFALGKMCMGYARKKKIPLVASSHTNWEDLINLYIPIIPHRVARLYARRRLEKFYNKVNAVIVPTSLMETILHLYFVRKPLRIIPTGIECEDTDIKKSVLLNARKSILKKHPRLVGKKILFYAGRLGKEKNIPFLMDVLGLLQKEFPDLVLLIAGDGPDRENLHNAAEQKGLSEKIIFAGFVKKENICDYYRMANVFVFASMVESQGLVTLEAMTCGVPVVAIGKMGTREVMGGNNGGFMVDDDIDMFTEKVRLLLKNKSVHREKSQDAIRHAQNWCMDFMAEKLLRLYDSILKKKI
ncbi:MAG TPA: glycosyltransferase [Spirochaetota bacterium]